jgi:hypothetical protein
MFDAHGRPRSVKLVFIDPKTRRVPDDAYLPFRSVGDYAEAMAWLEPANLEDDEAVATNSLTIGLAALQIGRIAIVAPALHDLVLPASVRAAVVVPSSGNVKHAGAPTARRLAAAGCRSRYVADFPDEGGDMFAVPEPARLRAAIDAARTRRC